jgi:AraC-like DNA-binding protein
MSEEAVEDFVPNITHHVYQKCRADWQLNHHFVDGNELTYIVAGKARYTINDKTHETEAGDLLCLTDGMTAKAVTNAQSPLHYYSASFDSLYPHSKPILAAYPAVNHIGMRKELTDLFRELNITWTNRQSGYIIKTRALLMLIIHRLSEILTYHTDSQTGDYRINKATHIIKLHYDDKLTVRSLAEQVRLNECYFGRLFKDTTGIHVHQYIKKIRVQNAEKMLQTGNYKVRDVAEQCGFSDVFHFYNSFRELRGFPPSRCIPKTAAKETVSAIAGGGGGGGGIIASYWCYYTSHHYVVFPMYMSVVCLMGL